MLRLNACLTLAISLQVLGACVGVLPGMREVLDLMPPLHLSETPAFCTVGIGGGGSELFFPVICISLHFSLP